MPDTHSATSPNFLSRSVFSRSQTDQAAQVADQRLEVILELGPDVFAQVVELTAQRTELSLDRLGGRRVGALDLRAFADDGVVAELLLLRLSQRAAELKLGDLRFLLEVD